MQITKYEIKSEKDLVPLTEIWKNLEKGEEMTAFQDFLWQQLLTREWLGWKLHALYSRVVIYVAMDGKNPVMIFPAIIYTISMKTRWFGEKKGVYLMGQGTYADYMNVIFSRFSPAAFEAIIAEIKKDFPGYRIILSSIRHDASLTKYLNGKNTPRKDFEVSLTVRRMESPEAYQASLSKNTRAHLRKDLNKMERDNIDYRIEVMGAVKDEKFLKEMVDLHVQRILIKNTKTKGILHILSAEVKKASGEMLIGNLNAFGPEANFSYPPKPAGNAAWNIDWTAKVRFRSHTMLMVGADFGGMSGSNTGGGTPAEPAKKKKCKGPLGIPLPDGAC